MMGSELNPLGLERGLRIFDPLGDLRPREKRVKSLKRREAFALILLQKRPFFYGGVTGAFLSLFLTCSAKVSQIQAHPAKVSPFKKESPKQESLFFLPREVETLSGREKKERSGTLSPSPSAFGEGAALFLGTLLFQDPHHWTLWINGNRIMSAQDASLKLPKGFEIQEVSETSVTFSMQLAGEKSPREVTLHPGQTYFPFSKEVRDGDHRSQLRVKTEN